MIMPGEKHWVDPKSAAWNKFDTKISAWRYALKGDSRRSYDEYGDAMGDWIASLATWQWFVTCTLARGKVSRGFTSPGIGSARACLRELVVLSCAIQFVCVFELQKDGVPHLHCLLAGCPAINGGVAQEHFFKNWGISRWKIYQPGGKAPRYLGKYLQKEVIELYYGAGGPYDMDAFKVFTGGLTKRGTRQFAWDPSLGGTRV